MERSKIYQIINECVYDAIKNKIQEQKIKQIVSEELKNVLNGQDINQKGQQVRNELTKTISNPNIAKRAYELYPDPRLSKKQEQIKESEDSMDDKRKAVMNALKDPKYNHAQLSYALWHPKDQSEKDTYRSLFSKMANGEPDNDGVIRHFSDEDINTLYQLIRKK